MMRIIQIGENQSKEWDSYVLAYEHSSPYQLFGWKRVLEKTYALRTCYFMAEEDGKPVGVLPLTIVKGRFSGSYISSMRGGLLAQNEETAKQLLDRAKKVAREEGSSYLKIRGGHSLWNFDLKTVVGQTAILDLTVGLETILKNFKSEARNRVRKAEKLGLQMDTGKQYLQEFYEVFAANMRDLGTPVFSFKFFQYLVEEFPRETDLLIVKLKDRVIAAMFMFFFKNTIYTPFIPSLKQYFSYCPNDLLYWKTIEYGYQRGIEYLDFGPNRKNPGALKFKRKFGAKLRDVYDYYISMIEPTLSLSKRTDFSATDRGGLVYQTVTEIWKRLPIGLTKVLGPLIRRGFPF